MTTTADEVLKGVEDGFPEFPSIGQLKKRGVTYFYFSDKGVKYCLHKLSLKTWEIHRKPRSKTKFGPPETVINLLNFERSVASLKGLQSIIYAQRQARFEKSGSRSGRLASVRMTDAKYDRLERLSKSKKLNSVPATINFIIDDYFKRHPPKKK